MAAPSALLRCHLELEELFLLHQEALLLDELAAAEELLALYCQLLAIHMAHEESVVLPLFERGGPVPRWPVSLYTGQHAKMKTHLEGAFADCQRLRELQGRELRRGVLQLLDREATYKHLEEHHDGAEREGLFPAVDRLAGDDEHAAIDRLLEQWQEAVAQRSARIGTARAVLDQR